MKNGEMERDWKVTKQTSNIPDILQTKQKYKKSEVLIQLWSPTKKLVHPTPKAKLLQSSDNQPIVIILSLVV